MARDPYKYFRVEARDIAEQLGVGLLELERDAAGAKVVPRLLRLAHTLKGAARVVRQPSIAENAHAIEDALAPYRESAEQVPRGSVDAILKIVDAIAAQVEGLQSAEQAGQDVKPPPEKAAVASDVAGSGAPAATSSAVAAAAASVVENVRSVTADVAEIDGLLDCATEAYTQLGGLNEGGKLAETAARLADLLASQIAVATARESGQAGTARLARFAVSADELRKVIGRLERTIAGAHERIDRELRAVRDAAEQLRLVPAGTMFPALKRAARDSARVLGKTVEFEGLGRDIRLDGHMIRLVQDALIQMIRNAVAHGIEAASERIAAGKPEAGRVVVAIERRGRHVAFRCSDDGRGVDVEALRKAAIRGGRSPAELARLDARGLMDLLLRGGLTTSSDVNAVAGRGIGMDIVREAVSALAGDFIVNTERGLGSTLELLVPLSLSSAEVLHVTSAGMNATIPLSAIRHALRVGAGDIHRTGAGECIQHAGGSIPLVPLVRLLGGTPSATHTGPRSAIVLGVAAGTVAISVDRMIAISSVVFRPLPELAPATPVVAGASLDVDGSPLLILDPERLVELALRHTEPADSIGAARRAVLIIDDSLTTRMLEQSILESAGYDVDVAVCGEDALERARTNDYALFLVDVEMPGMDGFTFVEHIRRDPKLHATPAILVTSLDTPEHKQRGHDVGAQGYVVKSEFDQAELLRHIDELVA